MSDATTMTPIRRLANYSSHGRPMTGREARRLWHKRMHLRRQLGIIDARPARKGH